MTEYNGGSIQARHLCVLVHGLWGDPVHLKAVAAALRDAYPEDELHLLVAKSNSGYFTYDGIETGGERVCLEIEDELAAIKAKGGHISKISVIGYSLGGLVARYTIGLLHAKGILDGLDCMNFTAFASPFLGVRSPGHGFFNTLWNVVGARTLSMSGLQLFGIDTFRDTGRPLLAVLADPKSVFIAGLARFRRRTLYANIVNDRSSPYYTSMATKTDPYGAVQAEGGEISGLPIRFVPGYDGVIIDRDEPIRQSAAPDGDFAEQTSPFHEYDRRLTTSPARIIRSFLAHPLSREARTAMLDITPFLALVSLLPLAVVIFLINAVYQTARSRRRRHLHEGGLAGIDVQSYRSLPLWMQNLQGTVEDAYESLNSAHDPVYTDDVKTNDSVQAKNATRIHKRQVASLSQQQLQDEAHESHKRVLALVQEQFAMIEGLNGLGWRKYPVWIHKLRHSHAAIISRRDIPTYDEGKVVLRHFLKEEFLV